MPTLRKDISVASAGRKMGRDDFDKDFFEFVLGEFVAELGEGPSTRSLPDWNDTMVSQSFRLRS